MSTGTHQDSTLPDVLYQGYRTLRDLGNEQPGFSLEKDAMRKLDLLDDGGVDTSREALIAVYGDGRVVVDLRPDA